MHATLGSPAPRSVGWLAAALDTLATDGVQGIRIERLARRLGITKGSFYWHFENREALLKALPPYWADRATLHAPSGGGGRKEAERRFLALVQRVERAGLNRYDVPMRAWARHDPGAARAVRRVDAERLQVVLDLFRQMGFGEEQAALRARISYYYLIGQASSLIGDPPEARERFLRLRVELLTRA